MSDVPPLQRMSVAERDAISSAGSVSVCDAVAVQPTTSVTFTTYSPAPTFSNLAVVCKSGVFQE